MVEGSTFGRGALFAAIALGIPLAACKLLSQTEATPEDAAAPPEVPAATAEPTAAPVDPAATAAPTEVAPALGSAAATAPAGSAPKVTVKLPDGGTAVVDAGSAPTTPALPSLPIFDASAIKLPTFDAATFQIPPGFPVIPGFGADSGK